ncbi:DUF190 domain-containing protein [Pampinifervens florentissimum]|uniref:DUF190 domain-containing protein n=1 Tax=Pampinifervens florentissimum TaxID=1632019 RepID=UPI0013B48DEA|nr:DUF190 domain-containing protein [Hydrogenobacter sp. T-8]QID34146.1 DUF190 domain-containing protein [Hydrogenobacter sp. T-8]
MEFVLVRIFLREDDKLEGKPAYRRLLELLKEYGVGGATVLKSIMGYGTTGELHYEGLEVLSYSLPVVVEFVEEEQKAMQAIERLLQKAKVGLITLERAVLWHSS